MDFSQTTGLRLGGQPLGLTTVAPFVVNGATYTSVVTAGAGAPAAFVVEQQGSGPSGAPLRHLLRAGETRYLALVPLPSPQLGLPAGAAVLAVGPSPTAWSLAAAPTAPAPPNSTVNLSASPGGPVYAGVPNADRWLQARGRAAAVTAGPASGASPLALTAPITADQAATNLLNLPGDQDYDAFPAAVSTVRLTGGGACWLRGVSLAGVRDGQVLTVFRTDGGRLGAKSRDPAAPPGGAIWSLDGGDVLQDVNNQIMLLYSGADAAWLQWAPADQDSFQMLADGTAAAPSLSFINDPTMGLFREVFPDGSTAMGVVAGGPGGPVVGVSVGARGVALGLGPTAVGMPTWRVDGAVLALPQPAGAAGLWSTAWGADAGANANRAPAGFAAAAAAGYSLAAGGPATWGEAAPGAGLPASLLPAGAQAFAVAAAADGATVAWTRRGAAGAELYVLLADGAPGAYQARFHSAAPPAAGAVLDGSVAASSDGRVVAAGAGLLAAPAGTVAAPAVALRQPDGSYLWAAGLGLGGVPAAAARARDGRAWPARARARTTGRSQALVLAVASHGGTVLYALGDDNLGTTALCVADTLDATGQWALAVSVQLYSAGGFVLLPAALSPDGNAAGLVDLAAPAVLLWRRRADGAWPPGPETVAFAASGPTPLPWARLGMAPDAAGLLVLEEPAAGPGPAFLTQLTRTSGGGYAKNPALAPAGLTPAGAAWGPSDTWGPIACSPDGRRAALVAGRALVAVELAGPELALVACWELPVNASSPAACAAPSLPGGAVYVSLQGLGPANGTLAAAWPDPGLAAAALPPTLVLGPSVLGADAAGLTRAAATGGGPAVALLPTAAALMPSAGSVPTLGDPAAPWGAVYAALGAGLYGLAMDGAGPAPVTVNLGAPGPNAVGAARWARAGAAVTVRVSLSYTDLGTGLGGLAAVLTLGWAPGAAPPAPASDAWAPLTAGGPAAGGAISAVKFDPAVGPVAGATADGAAVSLWQQPGLAPGAPAPVMVPQSPAVALEMLPAAATLCAAELVFTYLIF